jgi:hypothetical protein
METHSILLRTRIDLGRGGGAAKLSCSCFTNLEVKAETLVTSDLGSAGKKMNGKEKRTGAAFHPPLLALGRDRDLLIEWIESLNPSFCIGANARGIDPDHSVLFGAEGADPSLVHCDGRCLNRVTDVNPTRDRSCSRDKSVTALAAAGRIAVVSQD